MKHIQLTQFFKKSQSPVSFAEQVSASMNSSNGFILILHCVSEVQRMCPQGAH